MAKPLNPYQGAAPAAMGQMGQGILEAGANIGRTLQSGYESMGKSIGEGIKSAAGSIAGAYTQSKDDQAKFDATKKMFKAFESYLPTQTDPVTQKVTSPIADEVKAIFADTTISTREKIAMAPMLFNIIGNAQQQAGKERIADIMTNSREAIAAAKNPTPVPRSLFNASPKVNPLDEPVLPSGSSAANPQALQQQPPASGAIASYLPPRPIAQPQPMQQQLKGKLPRTRWNDTTKKMEFLNPQGTRYIEEPEDGFLFGPDLTISPY